MLYTGMLWQIQDRYTCKECSQLYFDDEQSNFNTSKQALSSILQLSRYLENKTLLVDPRFISLIQDVQTHFIGDKQLRIGEENLNDILESNSVVMAFFDRDGLDILNLLKSHNLSWKKFTDQSFEIIIDGISHRLIPFSLSKSEDYIEFILRKVKRIIPKFAVVKYRMENESFVGPADWIRFVWTLQRSRFISCEKDFAARYRQTYPQFFSGKPRIQNGIILTLQRFRNWAIERGMTPMLHAGTLLGWYRECGIITYTHDIDFTVFIEEHYDKFPDDVMNSSFIELSLRFNKPEDLLEYKVYIENGIPMDIFFLYHDQNSSWIGGLSGATKFIYPLINRTCATDLLGYLMYVPCNALDVIATEYGNWSEPLHSSKYSWNSSPRNKKLVGKIPPEERAESFIQYNSVKNKKANEKKSNPPIKRVTSQRAEHYKTSNVSQRLMNT
ncbi:Fukutin, putative [Brugia malayi]|uniref:Fukutin, putative n=1 Tax=Brugia malayi TaxID=6279 RepID=A0A4E9FS35_BRUMA|nr:Fukutin, putative [Brugia malayi]VIO95413.1 Fukutin, putative [Brugia malayi]